MFDLRVESRVSSREMIDKQQKPESLLVFCYSHDVAGGAGKFVCAN